MAKVLWLGDAGAHSGFAKVTESIGSRLVRDYGHDIHCLAVNYRGDYWPTDIKLYNPMAIDKGDIYGRSRYVEMLGLVEPDVVVILNDPQIVLNFLIDNPWDTQRVLLHYRPIIAYLPMDGYNPPTAWESLGLATKRVAMSKFGQGLMTGSELVYHGVDTDIYTPENKRAAKKAMGHDPDRFLVLRVDKNSIRKDYADTWRAMRPLLRKYDDIDVHFHCLPNSPDGINIKAFISNDLDIRDRLSFSQNLGGFTGWPNETMRMLYSAADVFVSTSYGEGFGLTIAEALACGTPVVASNVSSIPEVVGPGGILVDPIGPWTAPMGQEQMLPDVAAFTDAIERLYRDRGDRRRMATEGRNHVVSSFVWDEAAEKFDKLIVDLAAGASEQPHQTSADVSNVGVGS